MGGSGLLSRVASALARVWSVVVFGLATLAGVSAANEAARPAGYWLHDTAFAGFFLFFFQGAICLIVHELGHFAAARMVGWRLHTIAFGPFAYRMTDARFVFMKTSYVLSGFVAASPPSQWVRYRALRRAVFLSGGCFANFLLAALTFPFAFSLGHNWDPASMWLAPLGSLSIISLTFGITNLVPLVGPKGIRSDGFRILELLIGIVWPQPARTEKRKSA